MSDRELIELAARAADYQIEFGRDDDEIHIKTWKHGNYSKWSPLEDDGDAFRLAVGLRLDLTFYNGFQEVHAESSRSDGLSPSDEKYGDDAGSATRRAIVRAAAEIGRAMT